MFFHPCSFTHAFTHALLQLKNLILSTIEGLDKEQLRAAYRGESFLLWNRFD